MKTSRLWLISAIAAFLAVALGVSAAIATANAPDEPSASPSTSAAPSTAPKPTATSAPRPTASATDGPGATCENTVTDDFLTQMEAQGWTSIDTVDQAIGPKPFADFLDGTPAGAVVCRWAADPAGATDTLIDLAWAIAPGEAVADIVQRYTELGYVVTQEPAGMYLEQPGGQAYLLTPTDIRWAASRANLAYIKAPFDEG